MDREGSGGGAVTLGESASVETSGDPPCPLGALETGWPSRAVPIGRRGLGLCSPLSVMRRPPSEGVA